MHKVPRLHPDPVRLEQGQRRRESQGDRLDVTAQDVLVLKSIGPKGAPGMPEAGYLPIPMKLARAGVKDMVRISARRSAMKRSASSGRFSAW